MAGNRYIETLPQDFLAGLTGAVAGAPQAMGFALIAGVSPLYGLYTAVVSTLVATFTGSSVYMTVGPTNALALVVGTTFTDLNNSSNIQNLFTLTVLVGVFQFILGILRLGNLTRFVSNAVMTGFLTGAGALIIIGQLSNLTGYAASGSKLERFFDWLLHIPQSNPETMLTGLLTMALIFALRKTRFKNAATLIGLIFATLLVTLTGWHDVQMVGDISAIPSGLPGFHLPDFTLIPDLMVVALATAVLACVQSAAISAAVPQPDGSTSDISRDFIGQGLGNIVGGFFQGMPAGGSLSRTAVNISAGGRTRMANAFSGLIIAVGLLTVGGLIERITMTALAAQLIVAALGLLSFDAVRMVWRTAISARIAMSITFLSTLLFPLEYSIYIGVALSFALYVYTSASAIYVNRLVPTGDGHFRECPVPSQLPDSEVVLISVDGPLFFAAVKTLESRLPTVQDVYRPVVILRLRSNQYLGSTAIRFLERYAQQLRNHHGVLILAGINPKLHEQLQNTGVLNYIGENNIFYSDEIFFSATEKALAYANKWLQSEATTT